MSHDTDHRFLFINEADGQLHEVVVDTASGSYKFEGVVSLVDWATPESEVVAAVRAESVFVGSGIFKSEDPPARARSIVRAVAGFNDAKELVDVSASLAEPMPGIDVAALEPNELLQTRGRGVASDHRFARRNGVPITVEFEIRHE